MAEGGKPYRSGLPNLGPCLCAFPDNKKLPSILRKKVLESGVKIIDRIMMTDLIKTEQEITGAVGITVGEAEFCVLYAKAVILCTGASGFKPTGWPISNLTSDGDMMAYRIGAAITGKEFIDTHGTASDNPAFVGPVFLNRPVGEAPPLTFYTDGEGQVHQGFSVFHLGPEFQIHGGKGPITTDLPHGKVKLVGGASAGMATHKSEGIWPVGYDGGVGVAGLYAAGDSLGTMLSGAAYSAIGLALAGSAVTGRIAGSSAALYSRNRENKNTSEHADHNEIQRLKAQIYKPLERSGGFSPRWVIQLLQNTMVPYYTMIIKHRDRLTAALNMITFYQKHFVPALKAEDAHELRLALETKNMLCNAEMKLRASLFREESRGTHYREDFPCRDEENWNAWIKIRNQNGEMVLEKVPVPKEWERSADGDFLFDFPKF
jgi:succinate dehydrogenase/fumarate reductase flavoprotein subunit